MLLTKKRISIIVPAYNAEKTIKNSLKAIIRETKNIIAEIIVVDDNSNDNTTQIVSSFKKIKLIVLKKNKGAGNARNIGVKKAKYENLCFIDSDILIGKRSIYSLLKRLYKDKITGSVSATQDLYNLNKEDWSSEFVCLKSCFGTHNFSKEKKFSSICSEFCIISKKFFMRVGRWKALENAGGEEFDMGYKIRKLNRINIKLKEAKYSGYWCGILLRSKRVVARTIKYIPLLLKKKSFDTVGTFATSNQAFSALLSLFILLSSIVFLIFNYTYIFEGYNVNNFQILFVVKFFFIIQLLVEIEFLIYSYKCKGVKIFILSLFGIQLINFALIVGGLLFIIKSFYRKINLLKKKFLGLFLLKH